MTTDRILTVLADALEVDKSALELGMPLESIDTYDSAAIVSIMALFDRELGFRVNPDVLSECMTVGDIVAMVSVG